MFVGGVDGTLPEGIPDDEGVAELGGELLGRTGELALLCEPEKTEALGPVAEGSPGLPKSLSLLHFGSEFRQYSKKRWPDNWSSLTWLRLGRWAGTTTIH